MGVFHVLTYSLIILITICNSERIYQAPTITQRNPSQLPTYAQTVTGKQPASSSPVRSKQPTPSLPVRPKVVPIPTNRKPEFLPQNLTFVLSARNLKNKKADPVVKVSSSAKGGPYEKLGKTEELDNTANPDFLKVFWIIWNKGTQQKLKFEVRDVDNFRRDDPLGNVILDLDEYVAKSEKVNVTLQNGTGSLSVTKTTPVKFRLYARNLPNKDTIGHSDPYVEAFWSFGSKGKKIKFAKSNTIENNENPDWNITFEFPNFMKGTDQWWTFKVFDKDPTGSDDLGEASVEIDQFVAKRQTKMLRLGKTGTATLAITPA